MAVFVDMSEQPGVSLLCRPEVFLLPALRSASVFLDSMSASVCLQQLKDALGPDKPRLAGNGGVSRCGRAAGHALPDGGGDRRR